MSPIGCSQGCLRSVVEPADYATILADDVASESKPALDSKAGEVARGFNCRGIEVKVVDGAVHLLDGAVKIRAPFREQDSSAMKETILARVGQFLTEMRDEGEGQQEGADARWKRTSDLKWRSTFFGKCVVAAR